jgi:hypothetical protein
VAPNRRILIGEASNFIVAVLREEQLTTAAAQFLGFVALG